MDFLNCPLTQTGQPTTFTDEQTQDPCDGVINEDNATSVVFNFDVSGIRPTHPGTLTIFASGDIDVDDGNEEYTIEVEGVQLRPNVGGTGAEGCVTDKQVYDLSDFFTLAEFQAAAADGIIQVTASPAGGVDTNLQCFCGDDAGEVDNSVGATLEFPGASS